MFANDKEIVCAITITRPCDGYLPEFLQSSSAKITNSKLF